MRVVELQYTKVSGLHMEHMGVLYEVEKDFEVDYIIPAEFNTCVIFTGNKLHGAWIDDYDKYSGDDWRYSYVRFFHPNDNRYAQHQEQEREKDNAKT